MYVVLAFTPIVVQDGKRFLQGTSVSFQSVEIHVAMASAQGPTCAPAPVVIFPQTVERPQSSPAVLDV